MNNLFSNSYAKAADRNIGMVAAGVAYYAFIALVPMLAVVLLVYGLLVPPSAVAQHVAQLSQHLPASAAQLIGQQLEQISQSQAGAKGIGLIVALAIALFGARNAAGSIMEGLNIIAGVTETRGFLHRFALAMGITLSAVIAFAIAIGAIGVVSALPVVGGQIAAFAVVAIVGTIAAAWLYRKAPDMADQSSMSVVPGAVFFAVGWVIATAGFAFYVRNFGSYNATYGSLGAVIILLTWFYLTAWLLMFGGVMNFVRHGKPNAVESYKDS